MTKTMTKTMTMTMTKTFREHPQRVILENCDQDRDNGSNKDNPRDL